MIASTLIVDCCIYVDCICDCITIQAQNVPLSRNIDPSDLMGEKRSVKGSVQNMEEENDDEDEDEEEEDDKTREGYDEDYDLRFLEAGEEMEELSLDEECEDDDFF